ncbi:MAG: VWA domain-containing protein [Clostridia bacterium]|nr:VWA domain-containing protein [Clostridia bacterium]
MPNIYDGAVEVARRTMTLFFVVDASGSMDGSKMGTLNAAVEEVIPEIRKISGENADAAIKIAVLEFSSGARWITPAPMDAEDFTWSFLDADGLTDLGEACKALNEKLSRKAFMSDAAGSFAPAIFLLSDGEPTDDYKPELEKLKQNNWFRKAIKVAVAIGDDANRDVLGEFTGNKEAVLTVHTPEALAKMIRFVSVTASQIGSKSTGVGKGGVDEAANKQDEMVQKLGAVQETDIDDGDLEW